MTEGGAMKPLSWLGSSTDETTFAESSGNIYADLGFQESEGMVSKAGIARLLGIIITRRRLSQTRAADLLGLERSELVAILDGQFERVSLERMLRFLLALGQNVEITVRSKPRGRAAGRLNVAP